MTSQYATTWDAPGRKAIVSNVLVMLGSGFDSAFRFSGPVAWSYLPGARFRACGIAGGRRCRLLLDQGRKPLWSGSRRRYIRPIGPTGGTSLVFAQSVRRLIERPKQPAQKVLDQSS